MIKYITDRIAYIPASDEPLSADIGLILGDKRIYAFDTGNGVGPLNELQDFLKGTDKEVYCVISHFHADHMGNLSLIRYDRLFVGAHTYKYSHAGEVVTSPVTFTDGVNVTVLPLPSSHAKGCLALSVDDEYVFLGDGTYPGTVGEEAVYNRGLLQEELNVLGSIPADKCLLSHKTRFVYPKSVVIRELENVYSKRLPGEAYIKV